MSAERARSEQERVRAVADQARGILKDTSVRDRGSLARAELGRLPPSQVSHVPKQEDAAARGKLRHIKEATQENLNQKPVAGREQPAQQVAPAREVSRPAPTPEVAKQQARGREGR
jgi:hypothetical protein